MDKSKSIVDETLTAQAHNMGIPVEVAKIQQGQEAMNADQSPSCEKGGKTK